MGQIAGRYVERVTAMEMADAFGAELHQKLGIPANASTLERNPQ